MPTHDNKLRALDGLPEEILLRIFDHLKAFRKFKQWQPAIYGRLKTARENENRQRIKALAALCLVSRMFFRICQPLLFAGLVTGHGAARLDAVVKFSRALLLKPELERCVNYIETNRTEVEHYHLDITTWQQKKDGPYVWVTDEEVLALKSAQRDRKDSALSDEEVLSRHESQAFEKLFMDRISQSPFYSRHPEPNWRQLYRYDTYKASLTHIIITAHNLEHLCITMYKPHLAFNLCDTFSQHRNTDIEPLHSHYPRLKALCLESRGACTPVIEFPEFLLLPTVEHFDVHGYFFSTQFFAAVLRHGPHLRLRTIRFSPALASLDDLNWIFKCCPNLESLDVRRLMAEWNLFEVKPVPTTTNLHTLRIYCVDAPLEELHTLISACVALKLVKFDLGSYPDSAQFGLNSTSIRDVLLQRASTLEGLHIDLRRSHDEWNPYPLADFSGFRAMRSLTVCLRTLVGNARMNDGPVRQLGDRLPPNLERLRILGKGYYKFPLSNVTPLLLELKENSREHAQLKEIVWQTDRDAPELINAFAEQGVRLVVDTSDPWAWAKVT